MTPQAFEPLHDPVEARHESVFLVHRDRVLVTEHADGTAAPLPRADAERLTGEAPKVVLGRLGDTLYWASGLDDPEAAPAGTRLDGLRALHGHLGEQEWNIGGRATQLWDWHRDHQFCGRCGDSTTRAEGERAMRCPSCDYTAYPRLSPAVIVLIEHPDGRALLGRSGRWDIPMYSTLAGFVEAGESLEDTVHREIREEVGVQVDDIRYFGSQPWPFPNSLMLGFTATWAGGDIVVDGEEIADAQFFRHDDLPMIPPGLSIARQLIDAWIQRVG